MKRHKTQVGKPVFIILLADTCTYERLPNILRITSFDTSSRCLDLTLSVSVAKMAKSVPAGVESAASQESAVRKEMELVVENVQMLHASVPMAANVKAPVPVLWETARARSSRPFRDCHLFCKLPSGFH